MRIAGARQDAAEETDTLRVGGGLLFLIGVFATAGGNPHTGPKGPRAVDHAESGWYEDASGGQPDRSEGAKGMKMEWQVQSR